MAEIEDNLRKSDEFQDIMGRMPSWIVRRGSVVLLIIFIMIVGGSMLMKYPEVLPGNIIITCEDPPARLVARTKGRITLLFKDDDPVKKGDVIAVIENTASMSEINRLISRISTYEKVAKDPISLLDSKIDLPNNSDLGELQVSYNSFKTVCEEYTLFLELQKNLNKIQSCQKQLTLLINHQDLLVNKKMIADRGALMSKRQYVIDSALFIKKVLSQVELDKTEDLYIKAMNGVYQIREELSLNAQETAKIRALINDLILTNKDEKVTLEQEIKTAFKDLKTNVMLWQQKYEFVAPFDGKLSLYDYWNNNQFINEGDEVAHVLANTSTPDSVFGKLYVTGSKFGKVKVGQKVRVILESYPVSEYGIIYGLVTSISEVNKANVYVINVKFPKGLMTNYNIKINFKHEMRGMGEVITEDLSLFERIFYQFRALFVKKYYNVEPVKTEKKISYQENFTPTIV